METSVTVQGRRAPIAFQKRFLKFVFIGGLNNAGEKVILSGNDDNILELPVLKASISIDIMGSTTLPVASIAIFNAPEDLAAAISSVGLYTRERLTLTTQVIVYAASISKDGKEPVYSKVFEGGIWDAYMDYNAAPNPVLNIEAQTLIESNFISSKSLSFQNEVPVFDIVKAIVDNENKRINNPDVEPISVVNHGVHTSLRNPNFYGSMFNQLQKCAEAGDFEFSPPDKDKTIHIYPKNGGIDVEKELNIGRGLGEIGYPKYSDGNIIIEMLFYPDIAFGQSINIVNSRHKNANGRWIYMVSLQHRLSTQMPDGPWFTIIQMSKINKQGAIGFDQ